MLTDSRESARATSAMDVPDVFNGQGYGFSAGCR
jgi:hypothetical protein